MSKNYGRKSGSSHIIGTFISIVVAWYCIDTKQGATAIIISSMIALFFIYLFLNSLGIIGMLEKLGSRLSYEFEKSKDNRVRNINTDSDDNTIYLSFLTLTSKNAIAKMLNENTMQYNKISWEIPGTQESYRKALYKMIEDTKDFHTATDFEMLYTDEYFLKIIKKYFSNVADYIERHTNYSKNKAGYQNYIRILKEMSANINNYSLRKINIGYFNKRNPSDTFIEVDNVLIDRPINFIADSLLTYATITHIIFLEKKINALTNDDEFYKIIDDMIKEVDDMEIVYENTLPIYKEFYESKLGFVNEYMFRVATMIINDKVRISNDIEKEVINYQDNNYSNIDNISSIDNIIKFWLESLAKDNVKVNNIDLYTIAKINDVIVQTNNELLLECLTNLKDWIKYYDSKVEYLRKESDKNRYLSGDFSKEKQAKAFKYSLINVETGEEFELYLQNLFRELNYKVKHCGKSGDQGGDLIVKKGNITYVIQAKYYTHKLDNTPIQEVVGAIRFYNANRGVVITNSTFTKKAIELANTNRIILINGDDLEKLTECIYEKDKDRDFIEDFIK
jgi:hypothetical protein